MRALHEVFTPKVISKIKQQRTMRSFNIQRSTRSIACRVYKNNRVYGEYISISKAGKAIGIKNIRLNNSLHHGTQILEGDDRYDVEAI